MTRAEASEAKRSQKAPLWLEPKDGEPPFEEGGLESGFQIKSQSGAPLEGLIQGTGEEMQWFSQTLDSVIQYLQCLVLCLCSFSAISYCTAHTTLLSGPGILLK